MKFAFFPARSGGHHRARPALGFGVLLAGAATGVLAGTAEAGSPPTLTTAHSSTLRETIVVSSHSLTLYELRPETVHHLLCTKANGCFSVWPPLTVASAKAKLTAPGVSGRLAILHRNGLYQVTLSGHPLYRFAGDGGRKGSASGQDLHSFGGTWHVVATSSAAAGTPTSPTMTSSTPTYTAPAPTTPTYATPTTTTPTTPYYPPY